jgi:polyisoprenoid-binding protein YceI
MKKIILSAVIILIIAIAGYQHATRPTTAPSVPIASNKPAVSGTDNLFVLEQAETTASFTLGELLAGKPVTVVGTTNAVTGSFRVNPASPAGISFGEFKINARTFATDNGSRDNATRRFILKTEDPANEFIVFTPKAITGLPASFAIGSPVPVKVSGDLLISGITKPAVFEGTLGLVATDEFTADLQATVLRSDFNLVIPNIPKVTNVDDAVVLRIAFDAVKGE